MSRVKDGNYIVIQSFMVKELELKGNELLIYAIIYGFSQDDQKFSGSLQYLADWTNSSKQSVIKNLKSLCQKELLEKFEIEKNGVKFCEYQAKKLNGIQKTLTPSQKSLTGGSQKSLTGGSQKNLPNNIYTDNTNKDNDSIYIPSENKPTKSAQKKKYGEYENVLLTDNEYEKLKSEYSDYQQRIERLSEYVASTGKKYKSHYATIRMWAKKDVSQNGGNEQRTIGDPESPWNKGGLFIGTGEGFGTCEPDDRERPYDLDHLDF